MMRVFYGCLFILLSACSQAQSFDGSWKGEVDVHGNKLLLIFNIEEKSGAFTGTMESPMQTSQKIPVQRIQTKGDSIFIEVSSIRLHYAGRLVKGDSTVLNGQMQQGNFTSRLILVKSKNEKEGLRRKQDVFPPYPYLEKEVTVQNPKGSSVLSGTLTAPKETGKYPAVVLVNGSGQQNRDSEIYGHRPFKILADFLTRNGFVVLRYDDRGVGGSKGEVNKATTIHFASDASAAVDFLKTQSFVRPDKIGIIGHSEGALIASIVASENPAVAFIGLLAGPVLPGDSLMILQNDAVGKLAGLSVEALQANKEKNMAVFKILKQDKPEDQILQELKTEIQRQKGAPVNQEDEKQIAQLMYPWFRVFLKIDPSYYLKKVKVPIFAEFGGKDIQVPENENKYALQHLKLSTKSLTIKSYPNLNHLLQTAQTGAVSEYFDNPESINPQFMQDMLIWLKKVCK